MLKLVGKCEHLVVLVLPGLVVALALGFCLLKRGMHPKQVRAVWDRGEAAA